VKTVSKPSYIISKSPKNKPSLVSLLLNGIINKELNSRFIAEKTNL
jgi:hypothetical protein